MEQDVHVVVVAVDQGALVDHGVPVNRDDVPVDDVLGGDKGYYDLMWHRLKSTTKP